MELRNGSLVGGSPGQLDVRLRPNFEEGVRLVLKRWTALCLAVENEWGGRNSKEKAERLYEDILAFFYNHKEHHADDLEVDLEDIMIADFNTETEDDSPREVSKELLALHNELILGQGQTLARLKCSGPSSASQSAQLQAVGERSDSDSEPSSTSGAGEAGDAMDVDAPGAGDIEQRRQQRPQEPIIDEDGFQLVQTRRKGRGK